MEFLWVNLVEQDNRDEDGLLLRRLKAKDPQVVADLYDMYRRVLYVAIRRIVNNPGVAEDLVQETFLRAWHRAEMLNDEYGSVGPWLLSIARRGALDHLKSAQNRHMTAQELPSGGSVNAALEEGLLDADRVRVLQQALATIPPDQRTVLELAYFHGMSQTEIAAKLQQPLGTVKGWTRLGLQKLRHEIDRSLVYFK